MCCSCLTITLILISMCCKCLSITLILISEHLDYSSDLTEPKYHKTKQLVVWLKQANINIWNRALKYIFYFTKSLLTRSILSPTGKYLWQKLFFLPGTHFFLIPPFQNLGLKVVPQQKGRGTATVLYDGSIDHAWLTHFLLQVSFCTPWKQSSSGFLMFLGGIEETSGMKWVNANIIIKMHMQPFKSTFRMLKHEISMLPLHRNRSVDLHCISFDWSLYDINIGP